MKFLMMMGMTRGGEREWMREIEYKKKTARCRQKKMERWDRMVFGAGRRSKMLYSHLITGVQRKE